jgi:hypothetical protein
VPALSSHRQPLRLAPLIGRGLQRWGTLGLAVLACLLTAGRVTAEPILPRGPEVTDPGRRRCEGKELFQHRFPVEAQGIRCGQARGLLSRRCALHLHQRWSCLSLREDRPFVAWIPTEDLFKRFAYPTALLQRYPCSEAKVTPKLFGSAPRGFPTRRQLLADDVLRCSLLQPGDSVVEAEQMLGPADEEEPERDELSLIYSLGPERDSLVQIDPELLLIESKAGRITSVSMVQGG